MAILQAVTDCRREPLEGDGTVVVLGLAPGRDSAVQYSSCRRHHWYGFVCG